MKKILLSTIVLTAFSLSVILFQISCKKDAKAQSSNTATVTQENKILYVQEGAEDNENSVWTANYDGTNPQKLNIVLPADEAIDGNLSISPDHKKIFFAVYNSQVEQNDDMYSCNIDGSNVQKVLTSAYEAVPY